MIWFSPCLNTVERKTSFHTSSVQVWLATTQELVKIQEEGGAEEGAQGGYSRQDINCLWRSNWSNRAITRKS